MGIKRMVNFEVLENVSLKPTYNVILALEWFVDCNGNFKLEEEEVTLQSDGICVHLPLEVGMSATWSK